MRVSAHDAAAAVLAILLTVGAVAVVRADHDLAQLLTRGQPTEPEQARNELELVEGFSVELVAAEPDVFDPIALAFDEDGRLYVAEMRDYPFKPDAGETPLGQIRLLQDRDHDGRFETSRVFASGVQWPSGIAPYRGGVFVAAPPEILYLKDHDGDGQADERKVVITGFGTRTAEDIMNNLQWGLDNRIYGATSYNGGQIVATPEALESSEGRPSEGTTPEGIALRGRDFCFDPRTLELVPLSGGGDFGNAFDDWGNRFVANAGTLMMHEVIPGYYFDRYPYFQASQRFSRPAAGIDRVTKISPSEPWRDVRRNFWERWVNTTHDMRAERFSERELSSEGFVTGAAGLTIYRGHAFGPTYAGNSFHAEPAHNVVVRLRLLPAGVTFRAEPTATDQEFLASRDNWFRPVNVFNGPDGCLYVCDMYREIIEDPSAIPEDILQHLEVTNGRDRGRIYRIVPDGLERPDSVSLGAASSSELVNLLAHENGWQRDTAQRLLVERGDTTIRNQLQELALRGPTAQARIHALWSLHGLDALDLMTVSAMLDDPEQYVRVHALRACESLMEGADATWLLQMARTTDPSPLVRMQLALTLASASTERLARSGLSSRWTRILERDADDPWIRAAVLASVGDRDRVVFAELVTSEQFLQQRNGLTVLEELARMLGRRNDTDSTAAVLAGVLSPGAILEKPQAMRLFNAFAEDWRRPPGSLVLVAQELEDPGLISMLEELNDYAERTANDPSEDLSRRHDAVQYLGHAARVELLLSLVDPRHPADLQRLAVEALANQAEDELPARLLVSWSEMSPTVRRAVVDQFLQREATTLALVERLEAGEIAAGDIALVHREQLAEHADPSIRARAQSFVERASESDRTAVIERFRRALSLEGDQARGERSFTEHCSACHSQVADAPPVGPDLRSIGMRSSEELLQDILAPSRHVSPNYVQYVAETADGRTLMGIISRESGETITLRRAEGREVTLLRAEIESLTSTGQSLMPAGLEQELSLQEMADLLTYLRKRS